MRLMYVATFRKLCARVVPKGSAASGRRGLASSQSPSSGRPSEHAAARAHRRSGLCGPWPSLGWHSAGCLAARRATDRACTRVPSARPGWAHLPWPPFLSPSPFGSRACFLAGAVSFPWARPLQGAAELLRARAPRAAGRASMQPLAPIAVQGSAELLAASMQSASVRAGGN